MKNTELIEKILESPGNFFPIRRTSSLEPVCGYSLSKGKKWWKAVVLVKILTTSGEKYQLRLYAWQKNNEGEWKLRQKFNISQAKYISKIVDVLTLFAPLQIRKDGGGDLFQLLLGKISQLENELLEERAKRKAKFINAKKGKLQLLEIEIRKFSDLLSSRATETRIHQLLKKPKNAWFFGSDYRKIYKEEWITTLSRNDFLLEKHDGYVDIVELKSPSDSLFDRKIRWSSKVKDGVSQLMFYLSEARKKYFTIKDEKQLDIFLPKGYLIIGRRPEDKEKLERLRIHNEFLHKIEILTYDDLLDRAQKTLDFIKQS